MLIIFDLTLALNEWSIDSETRSLIEMSISMYPDSICPLDSRHVLWNGFDFESNSFELCKTDSAIKETSQILFSLWNQLHVDEKYQEYFQITKIDGGSISLGDIEEQIACIEEAMRPVPIKVWPSAPSERFREAQNLLSNLEQFWAFYRVSEQYRDNFKAAHKNLDNQTLGRIWEQHEIYRKLTRRERSRLSEQEMMVKMKAIADAIHRQRTILRKLWSEMKLPPDDSCDIFNGEIRAEHLTPEAIEFHEVEPAVSTLNSISRIGSHLIKYD